MDLAAPPEESIAICEDQPLMVIGDDSIAIEPAIEPAIESAAESVGHVVAAWRPVDPLH